jgi:hypothetical protein
VLAAGRLAKPATNPCRPDLVHLAASLGTCRSRLPITSVEPSGLGYGRAKLLVTLFGRPVPVTKGD